MKVNPESLPKLGRLPVDNSAIKKTIKLADVLTGSVPEHPAIVNHLAGTPFGMYENNKFGVCGPTGVANMYRLISHQLGGKQVSLSQNDVFDLYRRSGNPDFDPKTGAGDNGVNLQVMLTELVKNGIGGHKAVAFAKVDPKDEAELEAAMSIFGCTLDGVVLRVAQQEQTSYNMWKYIANSPEWGGHCVLGGKYYDARGISKDTTGIVSWAEVIDTDNAFRIHQQDEAWVVVWPEHLGTKQFQQGIDLAKLKTAYNKLTGRTLVA